MVFKVPAYIVMVVGGIWGLFISMAIVVDELGFIGGLIAFFLAPAALTFAPLYAAIADNNWFPILLIYGSGISAFGLYAIGALIDKD